MKGVILASGTGSRMAPFTNVASKAMSPIYTKDGAVPQIEFPLKVLTNFGITEVLILVSLQQGYQVQEYLGDGSKFGCNLTYKIQDMSREITGIAQALELARGFTGDDNFVTILGDNYFDEHILFNMNLVRRACIGVELYDSDVVLFGKNISNPQAFGVWDPNLMKVVEKPEIAPSSLAITGLYVYSKKVYESFESLEPSARNELEITDVNNWMLDLYGDQCSLMNIGDIHWQDMGTPQAAQELSKRLM